MEKYNGPKFYPTNERMERNEQVWWKDEYEKKVDFKMTRSYKTYLRNKHIHEMQTQLGVLKHKLETQVREDGECDPIDFGEYMALVNKLNTWIK